VKIAVPEPQVQKILAAEPAPPAAATAEGANAPAAPANNGAALPRVITPSKDGQQIITVPEAQRGR
jgi:hypothetical protein